LKNLGESGTIFRYFTGQGRDSPGWRLAFLEGYSDRGR